MKKVFLLSVLIITCTIGKSQNIPLPISDKATVCFVRQSSVGFAINFTFFDSTEVIGKFNGRNYFIFECEPGKHLFWARSENKNFLEADLEAGRIYLIEAAPQMGAIKAGVQLYGRRPNDFNKQELLIEFMETKAPLVFDENTLELWTVNSFEIIERALKKYKKMKKKGARIKQLAKSSYYQP
jgi:hypothetical protein